MDFEIQKNSSQVTLLCSCADEAHRDKAFREEGAGEKGTNCVDVGIMAEGHTESLI